MFSIAWGICMFISCEYIPFNRLVSQSKINETNAFLSNLFFCMIKSAYLSYNAHRIILAFHGFVEMDDLHENGWTLGANFFLWELIDLLFIGWYGLATPDVVLHHVLHIIMAPFVINATSYYYVGARMIAQETTNVILDVALFQRHRNKFASDAFFVMFAFMFFMYRVINMGALVFDSRHDFFILASIGPPYLIQLWWFRRILMNIKKHVV